MLINLQSDPHDMSSTQMKIDYIPLLEIVTGKSQARLSELDKDLDVLALSISKMGLLEPIIVFKNDDGKYEILAGQRRFSAVKQLGWDKIPAIVRSKPADEYYAKAISLTENVTTNPMTLNDTISACEMLFKRFGNAKMVAENVGLSPKIVRKYVKFARLPQSLKDAYDKGDLGKDPKKALNVALRATDALTADDNNVDEEKVLEFAKILGKKIGIEQKELESEAKKDPSRPIEEIVKKATPRKNIKKLEIVMDQDLYGRLETYSENQKLESPEDAASELITDGLNRAGV